MRKASVYSTVPGLIRIASSGMPRASASVNHTGFLPPRPDQVSGPSGFLYFGANAAPETAERGLTSDGRRSSRAVKRNFAHNDAHSFRISSRMAFFSASSIAWRASTSSSRAFRAERSVDSDMKKTFSEIEQRSKARGKPEGPVEVPAGGIDHYCATSVLDFASLFAVARIRPAKL